MGSIYLADDLRLEGRLCALKEVEHDRSMPEDLIQQGRDQFLREATVLARLDHPNLPKVSDYFSIGGRDYLVMDFVPGKDLRTLMNEARQRGSTFLSEREVLGWANQLADALLKYLHMQTPPILHRDIQAQQPEADSQRAAEAGGLWVSENPGLGGSDRDGAARTGHALYTL